jgi:hypothetical protein
MNLLRGTRTYLFGQMQYFDGAPWRRHVKPLLQAMGVVVFDPYDKPFINGTLEDDEARKLLIESVGKGDFEYTVTHMKKVVREDFRMVDASDFLFGYINPKYPTVGAWDELYRAEDEGKPVFLCIEGGLKAMPLWLFGRIPIKYVYDSVDKAVEMLQHINSGEKPIDSDRWRIFKQEYSCVAST